MKSEKNVYFKLITYNDALLGIQINIKDQKTLVLVDFLGIVTSVKQNV